MAMARRRCIAGRCASAGPALLAVLAVSTFLTVSLGVSSSAAAAGQTFTPTTTRGAIGRVVGLDGTGWSPGKPVQVQLLAGGSKPLPADQGTASIDPAGMLSGELTVPSTPPGHYQLWVCQACDTPADAPYSQVVDFTVIPTLTVPRVVTSGSTMTATGTNWPAASGEVLVFTSEPTVTHSSAAATTIAPSADSTFAATFAVPDLSPGEHQIYACQGCGGGLTPGRLSGAEIPADLPIVVIARYRIVAPRQLPATLTLTPADALPGGSVSATGTGWPASDGVVTIAAADAGEAGAWQVTAVPDARGRFAVRFPAPTLPTGQHTFLACQSCGTGQQRAATAAFVLTPPLVAGGHHGGRHASRLVVLLVLGLGALVVIGAGALATVRVRRWRRARLTPRLRVRAGEGHGVLTGPDPPLAVPSLRLVPHPDESPYDVQLEVNR